MTFVFENLGILKQDMIKKHWTITAFDFHYKSVSYIVLVKLFQEKPKNKYYLLQLDFLKANNIQHHLLAPANRSKLFVDTKTLREFFNINYSTNLGNILYQFDQILSKFIPTNVHDNPTDLQKKVMVTSLSQSDGGDKNKIYCYSVKRNPLNTNGRQEVRSIFNEQKTRLLRQSLFEYFKDDNTISFNYSPNQLDENTDEVIIKNWTQREQNK